MFKNVVLPAAIISIEVQNTLPGLAVPKIALADDKPHRPCFANVFTFSASAPQTIQ